MKKTNLVRDMWSFFVVQLAAAVAVTMVGIVLSLIVLQPAEKTNRDFERLVPIIQQKLQKEQNPDKLRREARGWLEVTVSEAKTQDAELHLLVKLSGFFGAFLFIYSLGMGISAYRLQRQQKET